MPDTTSATWPALTAGQRARASDVEAKFDFSEKHLWPHGGGDVTDSTYNLGDTTAAYWLGVYAKSINPTSTAAGVAIGTTAADAGAILDLAGTKALLVPRLSSTQRDALTPKDGMLLFNSTTSQYQFYRNAQWANIGGTVFRTQPLVNTTTAGAATNTALAVASGGGRINGILLRVAGNGSANARLGVTLDGVSVFTWVSKNQGASTGVDQLYAVTPGGGVVRMAGTSFEVSGDTATSHPYLGWDFATSASIFFGGGGTDITQTCQIIYSTIV